MTLTRRLSFAVVILAAGASTRMGRPKLLLPWGTTSVIGHLFEQWRALDAAQIGVVCAEGDLALAGELDRLEFPASHRILNQAPERGMFSSIQTAATWPGWQPPLTHWVLALGDQPHLRSNTLRALIEFAAQHPGAICQPAFRGRPRHPIVLPKDGFTALADTVERDLKSFLGTQATRVLTCAQEDPGLDLDLDSPADYLEAQAIMAAASGAVSGPHS